MLTEPTSFDKLIVEAYQKSELKGETHRGWTSAPDQRTKVKGLKVLIQAVLNDGRVVQPGSTAFVLEESLHNGTVGGKKYKSDTFTQEFTIINVANVEYIVPPSGDAA